MTGSSSLESWQRSWHEPAEARGRVGQTPEGHLCDRNEKVCGPCGRAYTKMVAPTEFESVSPP